MSLHRTQSLFAIAGCMPVAAAMDLFAVNREPPPHLTEEERRARVDRALHGDGKPYRHDYVMSPLAVEELRRWEQENL